MNRSAGRRGEVLLADRVRDGSDRYTAGGGRCGALLWVQPRDVARAARVLGAT